MWVGILCFSGITAAQGQDTLSLGYCFRETEANYPLVKDKMTLEEMSVLRMKNISSTYLPQFLLSGQATYQSTAINLTVPNSPIHISQSRDQYKATLEASQLLYDGGMTRAQKSLEQAGLAADEQQVEVDLYKVKEQVSNFYFLILTLQETEKLLKVTLSDLKAREQVMASSVRNGLLTESDLDNLTAERLRVEQQLSETSISKSSAVRILGILVNKNLSDSVKLSMPNLMVADSASGSRPEYALFDLQSKRLDASRKLTGTVNMPKISAFAQGGYGRPGLNMLDNNFNPYYIVGASLKWNLWDWNKNRRDRQVLEINKKTIDSKRETFEKNQNIDLQNKLAAITKLDEALQRDSMIVELRSKVVKVSASKLDNGVINTTDYITDLNSETSAKITMQSHKIQLQQAKTNYFITKGINIK